MGIDIYGDIRDFLIIGLGEVPAVGWLLEGLTEILWPDNSNDVWDQIKNDVEQLINQDLSDEKYANISEKLQGIQGLLSEYTGAVQTGDQSNIQVYLVNLILQCVTVLPSFQDKTYGVLLLPLTAQLANIHLGAIRDYYTYANTWGKPSVATQQMNDFVNYSNLYSSWVTYQYSVGRNAVPQVSPEDDPHNTKNWNALNNYDRTMQLSVLDFQLLWPSFRPDGSVPVPYLTREIYSDALGTSDEEPVHTPTDPQLIAGDTPLTSLQVWSSVEFGLGGYTGYTMQGAQPYYGGTPGEFVGGNSGSNIQTDTFNLNQSYPAVGVYVQSGSLFNAFQFLYQDGSTSNWFPSTAVPAGISFFGFDGHLLSSITIMGLSGYYQTQNVNAANCVVFGFRLLNSYSSPPQKPFNFPAFTQLSQNTKQTAVPFYVVHKSKTEGDFYDFLTDIVECGSRQLDGFDLVSPSPLAFLLPDNTLYPNAVPFYRMVAGGDSDRVMLVFRTSDYYEQQQYGWEQGGLLGYLLADTSAMPSIAAPQTVTSQPIYVLNATNPKQGRSMITLTLDQFNAQLTVGWSDPKWNKPVGYLFNAS